MSTTSSKTQVPRCEEVRFAEVDFPGIIESRLIIEYSDGLKIIVSNQSEIPLAAEFIDLKRKLEREGARQ